MTVSEFLENTLTVDSYIIVNKRLIQALDLNCAVMIGELVLERRYWRMQNKLVEGKWFYSTRQNIEENTGLTPYQQRSVLTGLYDAGLIEYKRMGCPAKMYYRLLDEKLVDILSSTHESTTCEKSEQPDVKEVDTLLSNPENTTCEKTEQLGVKGVDDIKSNNIKLINKTNKKKDPVLDKPIQPDEPVVVRNRTGMYQEKHELTDELGGLEKYDSGTGETAKPEKKKNLYQKCSEELDNPEYGFSDEVKKVLRDYLPFATDTSSEKRIKGLGMWKSKLKQLIVLSDNPSIQVRIVRRSINEGWFKFVALNADRHNRPTVDGLQMQSIIGKEAVGKEIERRSQTHKQF